MTTITITKEVSKEKELFLVTRKQYEQIFGLRKKARPLKIVKSPNLATKKKEVYDADKSIAIALKQIERGETSGPFDTAEELFVHLDGLKVRG